jgi:hypothetical protein
MIAALVRKRRPPQSHRAELLATLAAIEKMLARAVE